MWGSFIPEFCAPTHIGGGIRKQLWLRAKTIITSLSMPHSNISRGRSPPWHFTPEGKKDPCRQRRAGDFLQGIEAERITSGKILTKKLSGISVAYVLLHRNFSESTTRPRCRTSGGWLQFLVVLLAIQILDMGFYGFSRILMLDG